LRSCLFLLALSASVLAAPEMLAQSQQARSVVDSSVAVLAPGDKIRIAVWRDSALSGEYVIAPDGSITHPLYRSVFVAGLPLVEVEQRLRSFLSRFTTEPAFVISPLVRIIIGGEVRQPNVYTVPWGTTLAQAVALAGGPTDRGMMDRVRMERGTGVQTIDLTQPNAESGRVQVRSGDQIVVGRRREVMRDVVAPSSSIVAALASHHKNFV
jgi:polysaccharide export outer membrane protein